MVRHYDQEEREADGASHWNDLLPKLVNAFRHQGKQQDEVWILPEFRAPLYLPAIQGHIGGHMVMQELMGPVEIPYNWKEFVFHRGCSSNGNSIHETGLVAGGTESKEGRQTIFFTHLNPVGENQDEEEPDGDWRNNQDAVY